MMTHDIVCPICGATATDEAEAEVRYCGNCKRFLAEWAYRPRGMKPSCPVPLKEIDAPM